MKGSQAKQLIFLVGVKNTGKSHLARKLARDMDFDSADTDEEVADLYLARTGERRSVRTIYALDNGSTFRELEALACARAADSTTPLIVATGGGICDNPAAVTTLRSGIVVALEGEPAMLFGRIMRSGIPAFMSATTRDEAWAEFSELHERRQAAYRELAHFTVDVGGRHEDEVAAEIRARMEEWWNGGQ